jgi:hypothetical protein
VVPAALSLIEAQPRMVGSDRVFTNNGRKAACLSFEGGETKKRTPEGADWRLNYLRRAFHTEFGTIWVASVLDLFSSLRYMGAITTFQGEW